MSTAIDTTPTTKKAAPRRQRTTPKQAAREAVEHAVMVRGHGPYGGTGYAMNDAALTAAWTAYDALEGKR